MNSHLIKNWIVRPVYVALLLAVVFHARTASAVSLSPVRFELSGNPGQLVTGEILITNEGKYSDFLYSSTANFEAQGESGSPAFVEPKDGIGTWIDIQDSVSLEPGVSKTIPFSINIPKNAEPGGHFGVIFFGNTPKGSNQVSVGSQTGALVLLSVSGDVREDAGLLSFNTKDKKFWYKTLPVTFEYRFKNDGGDRVKPQGKINIRNTAFIRTERLDANPVEGNVLPGSTRKFQIEWLEYSRPLDYLSPDGFFSKYWDNVVYEWKNFAIGLYSANLRIEYGSAPEKARDTAFFFVFPWELAIVLIIVILVLFFGGRALIRRYNRHIIAQAQKGNMGGNTNA